MEDSLIPPFLCSKLMHYAPDSLHCVTWNQFAVHSPTMLIDSEIIPDVEEVLRKIEGALPCDGWVHS